MENQDNRRNRNIWSRWLRVSILTFSMAGPVINTFLNQMRKRSQTLREQAGGLPDTARTVQTNTLQRLDELTLSSRERAIEQAQLLHKQAQQLRAQAKQLRKALRAEAKQRQRVQQLQKQLQKSSMAMGQDLLKRGSDISQDLLKRGSKSSQALLERGSDVSQVLLKRGSKSSQALLERGSDVSQALLERGSKVSQDLLERGGKLSHNVAERSGQILEPIIEPMRKRNSRFWTVFGFTTGLFAAGIVTYVMVRRRIMTMQPNNDTDDANEQIELPPRGAWQSSSPNRPSGEIRHVGSEGTADSAVATMTSTNEENAAEEAPTEKIKAIQATPATQTPADVAFVGVVSTKLYYSTDTTLEEIDVVYFVSEDEARAEGFIPAPTS